MKRIIPGLGLALACAGVVFSQTPALPSPVFSAGSPISSSEMNANFAALLQSLTPTGTVIASFVPPDASGDYMSATTGKVWAFADGSKPADVPAAYTWEFPDMRGQFIRGVNMGRTGSYSDPDAASRIDGDINDAGSTQADAFQGHAHKWLHQWGGVNGPYSNVIGTSNSDNNIDNGTLENALHPMTIITDRVNGTPQFSTETRPDNVAVYWYIKVK
jgi:hypothetical protein